ncbi:hypothetical protein AVEN_56550-1 [Araneus ventricosus]|uniref:Uncharacterized protein n=1 Tax=Araneus ventricosus TaxID=182803 RepID=A0A4Y2HGU2_ARAVE|nr:hypothetical protein AVEN_56550-1 [Araneus ventricosus]
MTRRTPELSSSLQTSTPHQREDVWPLMYDLTCNRPNTRRIFSGTGFRAGTLRPQSRDLTTRPPRPPAFIKFPISDITGKPYDPRLSPVDSASI